MLVRCQDIILQVKVMKALEKQLDKAGGKFITGSRMTLADFVLLSQMQDLKALRLESGDYPRHGFYLPILRSRHIDWGTPLSLN